LNTVTKDNLIKVLQFTMHYQIFVKSLSNSDWMQVWTAFRNNFCDTGYSKI